MVGHTDGDRYDAGHEKPVIIVSAYIYTMRIEILLLRAFHHTFMGCDICISVSSSLQFNITWI